jgi:hypothetical protein
MEVQMKVNFFIIFFIVSFVLFGCLLLGQGTYEEASMNTRHDPGNKKPENGKTIRPYVRFGVGIGLLDGGDFNKMISRNETRVDEIGHRVTEKKQLFFVSYLGEIGICVKRFSLGLGVEEINRRYTLTNYFRNNGDWDRIFSAVAFSLNIKYVLWDLNWMTIAVSGGPSIYLGQYREEYINSNGELEGDENSKQTSFGFHLGSILQFRLNNHFYLNLDTRFRMVNFNAMEGYTKWHREIDGKLAYAESSGFFGIVKDHELLENVDLRQAKLNFNGLSISLGLQFIF